MPFWFKTYNLSEVNIGENPSTVPDSEKKLIYENGSEFYRNPNIIEYKYSPGEIARTCLYGKNITVNTEGAKVGSFKSFYTAKYTTDEIEQCKDKYIVGDFSDRGEIPGLKSQSYFSKINPQFIPKIYELGELFQKIPPNNYSLYKYYNIQDKASGGELDEVIQHIFNKKLDKNHPLSGLLNEFYDGHINQPLNIRINKLKEFFLDMAKSLKFIHDEEYFHFDMKLNNMILHKKETKTTEDGSNFSIKLIDFGMISHLSDEKKKNSGYYLGTQCYFNKKLMYRYLYRENAKYINYIKECDEKITIIVNKNIPESLKKRYIDVEDEKIRRAKENYGCHLKGYTYGQSKLSMFNLKGLVKIQNFIKNNKHLYEGEIGAKEDIYALGLMFQSLFALCISSLYTMISHFDIGTNSTKNKYNVRYWVPGMNLDNIIESENVSTNKSLGVFSSSKPKEFNEYEKHHVILELYKDVIELYEGTGGKLPSELNSKNINEILDEIKNWDNDKIGFLNDSGKELTDSEKSQCCYDCFGLLNIIKKMTINGEPKYDSVDEIIDDLEKIGTYTKDIVETALDFKFEGTSAIGGGRSTTKKSTKKQKGGLKGFTGSTKLASGPQVYSISGFPGSLEDTSKPHFSAVLPPQITPTKLNQTNMTQKDIEVSKSELIEELNKSEPIKLNFQPLKDLKDLENNPSLTELITNITKQISKDDNFNFDDYIGKNPIKTLHMRRFSKINYENLITDPIPESDKKPNLVLTDAEQSEIDKFNKWLLDKKNIRKELTSDKCNGILTDEMIDRSILYDIDEILTNLYNSNPNESISDVLKNKLIMSLRTVFGFGNENLDITKILEEKEEIAEMEKSKKGGGSKRNVLKTKKRNQNNYTNKKTKKNRYSNGQNQTNSSRKSNRLHKNHNIKSKNRKSKNSKNKNNKNKKNKVNKKDKTNHITKHSGKRRLNRSTKTKKIKK